MVHAVLQYPPLPAHPPPVDDNPVPTVPPYGHNAPLDHDPDSAMAADSPTPTNRPLENFHNEDRLLEPEDDLPEVWDMESIYSDSSEDMLDDAEDEQVVPASFILPSSPLIQDDPSTDDQPDPVQVLDDQDTPQKIVYGSSSKCYRIFDRSEAYGPYLFKALTTVTLCQNLVLRSTLMSTPSSVSRVVEVSPLI